MLLYVLLLDYYDGARYYDKSKLENNMTCLVLTIYLFYNVSKFQFLNTFFININTNLIFLV